MHADGIINVSNVECGGRIGVFSAAVLCALICARAAGCGEVRWRWCESALVMLRGGEVIIAVEGGLLLLEQGVGRRCGSCLLAVSGVT